MTLNGRLVNALSAEEFTKIDFSWLAARGAHAFAFRVLALLPCLVIIVLVMGVSYISALKGLRREKLFTRLYIMLFSMKKQEKLFWDQGDFGYIKKRLDSMKTMCEPDIKVKL